MRVYIAGPDVFRPDLSDWSAHVRSRLAALGHQALIPTDSQQTTAGAIYAANVGMIRHADALLANVNPFRGDEPDSGTCFEIGFASALGTPVIAYLDDARALKDRLGGADARGQQVEDFGLPLNLMLGCACRIVVGGIDAAIDALETFEAFDVPTPRQDIVRRL